MGITTTYLMNPWPQAKVLFKKSTSSTMEDACKLVDTGVPSGTVIYTDFQKKGKGRFIERKWISEKGQNLLATLILDASGPAFPISMLPLAMGLCISLCIEDVFGVHTLVKWPNDILADGKKLAGVICESHRAFILVGLGINCNQTTFPPQVANKATSLAIVTGKDIEVPGFLGALLAIISSRMSEVYPHESLQDRLAFEGEHVKVLVGHPYKDNHTFVEGIIEGIDREGRLVISDPKSGTMKKIVSGEIVQQ